MSLATNTTTIQKLLDKVNNMPTADEVYAQGIEAGKQAEYDAFWDAFQQNGNRTHYGYAFAGQSWTPTTFKPKYDIKVTRGDYMWAQSSGLVKQDLTALLESAGVTVDTSECTNFTQFFRYESPYRVPAFDTRACDNLNNMFMNCSVGIVDKLIFREDGTQTVVNMIYLCPALKTITEIEGVIGQNMNLSKSTALDKQTITNIINALSSVSSGMTLQLSKTAVNTAFKTSQESGAPNDGSDSQEWLELAGTKQSNWTITLI